jgi:predicted lipoprotein with Yx(FWY)xxD motif
MRRIAFAMTTAAVVLSVASCGTGGQTANTRAVTTAPPPRPAATERQTNRAAPAVLVAGTTYGQALTDRRGFALYRFTHDSSATSTCYGACATAWPPYIVSNRPSAAGPGADASLLGAVKRQDGRLQLTYAGRPLYYYVGDRRPGQVLCQAVTEYGGTWNVVAPDGHAIP